MLRNQPNSAYEHVLANPQQLDHEELEATSSKDSGRAWAVAHLPGLLLGGPPQQYLAPCPLPFAPSLAIDPTHLAHTPFLTSPTGRYGPSLFPMDSTPFEPTLPGDPFFDIYTDDKIASHVAMMPALPTPASAPSPALPAGQCNFIYITPGTNGVRCGCRRFWSRTSTPKTVGEAISEDQYQYQCMCSHHACFHDNASTTHPAPDPTPVASDKNDAAGKVGRGPLSPLQDVSFRYTPGLPSALELPGLDTPARPFPGEQQGHSGLGLSKRASPAPEGSLPDTLCWGDDRQSPNYRISPLPPIPSQCLMPSRPSSVADSSQSRYLRPFAGRGLQTLSGSRNPTPRHPLQEKPVAHKDGHAKAGEYVHGDKAPDAFTGPGKDHFVPGQNFSQDLGDTQPFGSYTSPSREALRNITDTVDAHEQRLDRLENTSFSVAGHEDCSERQEQMDLRVTELESRVEEVEKAINDSASQSGTRGNRLDTSCSVASEATSTTTRAMYSSELFSQVQSLQAQVTKMQAALPSFEHPWEVEVVFLPFPLRKIWQGTDEFKTEPNLLATDEWTQLPSTYSASTSRARSPLGGEWAENHQSEWLLPKACGPNGLVDRRLRSRGFIRTISVKGPDARSVQVAMQAVFGGLFRELRAGQASTPSQRRSLISRVGDFRGLAHDWVPLRKVHKDSRLRFLSPSEMVSASLWDIQFLNSVIMKSSEPRLFITQPQAYVQDIHAFEGGWTWQRLRELPRFSAEAGGLGGEVPEADAMEEHWTWNEQLDSTPEYHASASHSRSSKQQRVSSSPSQQYYTGIESLVRSSTPTRAPTPGPVRTARKRPQLPHIRTTSMPPSLPPYFSPYINRRVVSSGQEVPTTVRAREPSASGAVAKRRPTRSPSRARFTPRWSTKSPSPMVNGHRLRSTTPFNYATPYSNGPGIDAYPTLPHNARHSGGHRDAFGLDVDDHEHDEEEDDDDDDNNYDDDDDDNEGGYSEEVEIYDEGSSGGYGEGEAGVGGAHAAQYPYSDLELDYFRRQLPEDEPWPGIEDRMSDGENVDPRALPVDGDGDSEMSSQPSEYPSTQVWNACQRDGHADFHIHEDANAGETEEDDDDDENRP